MNTEWDDRRNLLRGRIRRKVSLAVLLVDDFTGRPITGADITVSAEEMLEKPLRKEDGYYLFMDYSGVRLTVTAGGWCYHSQTVQVELAELPPLRPVIRIRLTPNRNYAVPTHTTCIEGRAHPNDELRVVCLNDPRPLRLLYDYVQNGEQDGRSIRLYDPSGSDLEGRTFVLVRKGEEPSEYFTLGRKSEDEEGGYRLTAPLRGDCKKAGTSVLPVYTARADAGGEFFLPLPFLAVKEYECRILIRDPEGRIRLEQHYRLEPSRVTRLELEEA